MKLAKCLKITKTKKFDVFVYPKGHIKYKRGIDEVCTDSFEVERDQNGKIIMSDKLGVQMFRTMLSDNTELSDEKINELANAFMDALPTMMKIRLQGCLKNAVIQAPLATFVCRGCKSV